MDEELPSSKRDLLEGLLDRGMVMVHIDARNDGVEVPPELRDESGLRLNLSYRFRGGLRVDEDEVTATLRFSGRPYQCVVPLEAVFAMVSHVTGEGYFFPSDAPAEALAALAQMVEDESGETGEQAGPEDMRPTIPRLTAIDGGLEGPAAVVEAEGVGPADSEQDAEDDAEATIGARSSARPSHLRVVK